MNDLLIRTVSGIILAVVAVVAVIYLPVWTFKLLIAVLTGIGTWEVFHLLEKKYRNLFPVLSGMAGFISSLFLLFISPYLSLFSIFLYSFFIAHRKYSIESLTASVFGLVYPVFFISSLGFLLEENRYLLLVLFATVWAGDTFAYFVGKSFGRHKFAPKLSPKKTWEGAIGGFLGAVVCGTLVSFYLGIKDAVIPVTAAGILMQTGDLFESFIKRQVGEKDSSHLIPGHGGILDRIDALIFASVVFLIFYQIKSI
ncbi:MAG: phosphatidate cytidylyltransferase [Persephonella sp.]|nr:phosphatidate cytidylyltransferase [Persephonella sp.]